MATTAYEYGLHALGVSAYAYLQPNGSWGWSNAGLIVDGDQSMLVDTLFDLQHTRRMLDEMHKASRAARSIDVVVNTHANGDHCWGNQLVSPARIIASANCATEMTELLPQTLAGLMKSTASMGEVGEYLTALFGSFDFEGIMVTPPTETFEAQLELKVGDKVVRLMEVGPAHSNGDILVYVPADRVVFAGDILFNEAHPVIWAGPVENWLAACDTILDMDVDVVVPGHGPLADKESVRRLASYLEYLLKECKTRYAAGMSAADASRDIALDAYGSWTESERIVINVSTIYRNLGASDSQTSVLELFTVMNEFARERGLFRPS